MIKVQRDTIVRKVLKLSHLPELLRVWVVVEYMNQLFDDLLVLLVLLFTTMAVPVLETRIIIVKVHLQMLRGFVTPTEIINVVVHVSMCPERVHATFPNVCGSTVELAVKRCE